MFCSANRVPAAARRRGSESARAASGRRAARCNGASPSDPPRAHGRPRHVTPSRSRRSRLAFLSRRCEAPVGGDSGRRPAAPPPTGLGSEGATAWDQTVCGTRIRDARDSDPRCARLGSEGATAWEKQTRAAAWDKRGWRTAAAPAHGAVGGAGRWARGGGLRLRRAPPPTLGGAALVCRGASESAAS